MDGIVYAYRNKINGKHYVGQTVTPTRRKSRHLSGNSGASIFNRAVLKYGKDAFAYEVLVSGVETKQDLNAWERYFIWFLQAQLNGYNITEGGDGMDSETAKVYAAKRLADPVFRAKNLAHMKRLTTNPEWLAFKLVQNREQSKDPKWIESNRLSRERSYANPEWMRKRLAAAARTKADPVWREKMKSIAHANMINPEWRRKNLVFQLSRSKLIYCIGMGKYFRGVGEASRFFGIDRAGIRLACQCAKKSAAGFKWRYATEEETRSFNERLSKD